jgi:hypothetical protein
VKKQSVHISVLILIALSFVLIACGAGAGSSPVDEARSFLESFVAATRAMVAGRSPVDAAKLLMEAVLTFDKRTALALVCAAEKDWVEKAFASPSAEQLEGLTVDLSGVKFEVVSQSGDMAEIKVSGKLRITSRGQVQERSIDGSPNTIMKNEGGWKYCGHKI